MAGQVERRESPRRKCAVKRTVLARVGLMDQELSTHLYLVDLGDHGSRVHLERELEPDSRICLRFPLSQISPDLTGEFEAPCRVVWTRQLVGGTCAHGLEFLEPSPRLREQVELLLEYLVERAECQAVRLREPVELKVRFPGEEDWAPLHSARELSTTSLRFSTSRAVAKGAQLDLRLFLEAGTVETRARVEWCRPSRAGIYDLGCSFPDLSEGQRSFIVLHLRRDSHRPLV